MTPPTPLIAGNWKMNGTGQALGEARAIAEAATAAGVRLALCPPATLVERMSRETAGSKLEIGGQDCHSEAAGAFTGDVSAEMLVEAGARLVILGHSERRAGHGESDATVAAKVSAALRVGLEPIICVGETRAEREEGRALAVVTRQIRGSLPAELSGKAFTVAYEPVWAIGTGLTPTLEDITEVHHAIRATLKDMFGAEGAAPAILYGGSVKPGNAAEILALPEVGGALVGGASLKAADFLAIVAGAPKA
ncbi:triose-phosphate isomerase [Phenylobacterium sp.]|jgi:triosephosphate isomerase|uniref:triose-phosphate isomerase n=1 Tax=Phenylobacterium sp. TaxID=1871053 RepID=UPI004036C718